MPPPTLSNRLASINGVRLADSPSTWDIQIQYSSDTCHSTIASITPHDSSENGGTAQPPLVLPALTHPHIHLDKAFVHSASKYAHLLPSAGTFQEALSFTTEAKKGFTNSDLLTRGEWLLAESVSSGVTAMRAFVEVDHTVQLKCLDAAVMLKDQWSNACEIQIVCFAQDPIFSSDVGEENMSFIERAFAQYPQIDVIGTTPYVESSIEAAKKNISWAIDRALQLGKHLDFHLDYNLDPEKEALVWYLLDTLKQRGWTTRSTTKRVMLGHCTRLSLFDGGEWAQISRIIHEDDLPVSFVGLPTSDLYMAAPPHHNPQGKPRGTLKVPEMIRKYNLDAVMGINNVGNAFTPWGSADPLFLACLGVGIYQAGTQTDAELLYECVSTRARAAIGLSSTEQSLAPKKGDRSDLILFRDRDDTGYGISRPRTRVAEIVWDPPARINRDLVVQGRLNASRGINYDAEPVYRYL
jgi:cytosine/adenosine deaminase-related metal-dependent hydrolase